MTLGKVLTMALMGVALTGIEAAAQVPTVWVIGDSTASNVDRRGWADPLGGHCQPRGWRYAIAPLKTSPDFAQFQAKSFDNSLAGEVIDVHQFLGFPRGAVHIDRAPIGINQPPERRDRKSTRLNSSHL